MDWVDEESSLLLLNYFNVKNEVNADFSVTLLNPSYILIKLMNDLDYSRVFAYRSYFVNNCYMKLTKWSPLLDIGVELPISFPNLRPHIFSPRILHALDSLFGRPLKVDYATSIGSWPSVA
ncbi:hypothetical protein IEQ34_014960 [Dendrobium chrysotoxum]|uniref:DUF4283 domain-containing protein n=1 Tax=Dendrobium chrysotoxum TaxID=161865 RepID=A0AAV7GNE3_DENCH|nr:hypothetical protein IEQ34_014960 [Dendrobium chrysotoxum]